MRLIRCIALAIVFCCWIWLFAIDFKCAFEKPNDKRNKNVKERKYYYCYENCRYTAGFYVAEIYEYNIKCDKQDNVMYNKFKNDMEFWKLKYCICYSDNNAEQKYYEKVKKVDFYLGEPRYFCKGEEKHIYKNGKCTGV